MILNSRFRFRFNDINPLSNIPSKTNFKFTVVNYIPALSRLNRQPNRKKERCNPHQRVRKAVNRDETDRRLREQRKDRQTINQQKTEKYSRRRQRGGRNKQRKIVGQETERNKRITTDTVNEIVRTERQRDRETERQTERQRLRDKD